MSQEPDLFDMYRWMLVVIGTVYTLICMAQTLFRWLDYFGESRRTQVLGHYAVVLLLRVRLRKFMWDLCQIGALLAIFGLVVYAHRWLPGGP